MLTIDNFISHRFRGFAARENSLEGLRVALAFGVEHLEFDIRVAACGTPMIYHDEVAKDGRGKKRKLADYAASQYQEMGGAFALFPSFEDLLQTVAGSGNKTARLLIDIKDAGFETEIVSLVRLYRLHDRVTYVSWVPEALYACHNLEPDAPLCLSHWCKKPGPLVRKVHHIYTAKNGDVPRTDKTYIHGERSGWFVGDILSGDMADMLTRTGGSVCVPVDMVTKPLVDAYHAIGIEVSVFSYVDLKKAQAHRDAMGIDLFFVDKKRVFDAFELNTNLSLEEIENDYWGKPKFPSGLVISCHEARKVPLKNLKPKHLRVMIGQKLSLSVLMPMALSTLKHDPLIDSYYFEGDLLQNVLRCDDFFTVNAKYRNQLHKICQDAKNRLANKPSEDVNLELLSLIDGFLQL